MIMFMIISATVSLAAFTVAIVQHEQRHQKMEQELQEIHEQYVNPDN